MTCWILMTTTPSPTLSKTVRNKQTNKQKESDKTIFCFPPFFPPSLIILFFSPRSQGTPTEEDRAAERGGRSVGQVPSRAHLACLQVCLMQNRKEKTEQTFFRHDLFSCLTLIAMFPSPTE